MGLVFRPACWALDCKLAAAVVCQRFPHWFAVLLAFLLLIVLYSYFSSYCRSVLHVVPVTGFSVNGTVTIQDKEERTATRRKLNWSNTTSSEVHQTINQSNKQKFRALAQRWHTGEHEVNRVAVRCQIWPLKAHQDFDQRKNLHRIKRRRRRGGGSEAEAAEETESKSEGFEEPLQGTVHEILLMKGKWFRCIDEILKKRFQPNANVNWMC